MMKTLVFTKNCNRSKSYFDLIFVGAVQLSHFLKLKHHLRGNSATRNRSASLIIAEDLYLQWSAPHTLLSHKETFRAFYDDRVLFAKIDFTNSMLS
jgi:low temperature requirement protein LtrA